MAQWYFDEDADLQTLDGMTIAIIGYGNQGRSQALNLRDSGLSVIVGSRRDQSYDRALVDGFPVFPLPEAARRADILFLLLPDEVMPQIFETDIADHLKDGGALVFASGYNITFDRLRPPPTVDLLLLAPRMIGQGVRDNFLNGQGFPSLVAVEQDASGHALERTLALARGIGSTKMGVVMSSFEEETTVDLFSEHLGPLYALRRHYEALVEAGCSPEVVLLELYASGESVAIAQAYRDLGIWEQITLHSRTSQYGQEVTARLSSEQETAERRRLAEIIRRIRSGAFADDWQKEQESGFTELERVRRENLAHPMVQEERKLYRILGRISE